MRGGTNKKVTVAVAITLGGFNILKLPVVSADRVFGCVCRVRGSDWRTSRISGLSGMWLRCRGQCVGLISAGWTRGYPCRTIRARRGPSTL